MWSRCRTWPNSIEIWQTFRDAWSKSVIFGKQDPNQALADAASKIIQPRLAAVGTASRDHCGGRPAAPVDRQTVGDPRDRAPADRGCCSAPRTSCSSSACSLTRWGLAVWMSFHRYIFTAPRRECAPPVCGSGQLQGGAHRPGGASVVREHRRLPGDQRAADCGAVAAAGHRAERSDPVP